MYPFSPEPQRKKKTLKNKNKKESSRLRTRRFCEIWRNETRAKNIELWRNVDGPSKLLSLSKHCPLVLDGRNRYPNGVGGGKRWPEAPDQDKAHRKDAIRTSPLWGNPIFLPILLWLPRQLSDLDNSFIFQRIMPPGFPGGSVVKNLSANTEDTRDTGLIPGLGISPREENGHPLQYSCLENSMDRGAWRSIVHRVTKSQTQMSNWAHTLQSTESVF